MKSLKPTLKLILYSLLTLAIISCSNNNNNGNNKKETTTITISTAQLKSISRGVKGTYSDITAIILDISDTNGKFYAKGQPFKKASDITNDIWTVTVDNIPVAVELTFMARAYNDKDIEIFNGTKTKSLTLQSAQVFIDLFPISDGIVPSVTKITSVVQKENGVLLNIEDDKASEVLYKIYASPESLGFIKTTGNTSKDTDTEITGIAILDSNGKGRIELTYKDYKAGAFIHDITLNNQIGGVVQTTFTTSQNSDADVIIGVAPTVNGINFKKLNDNKLQAELNVSDDKDISDLIYSWSFINSGSNDDSNNNPSNNTNIENNATNPIIINNFNDNTQGTLIAKVTDATNLSYTYTYTITSNQFKTNDEFKVSSTSVDDNKILSNENLIILFNKDIKVSTVNNDSIFISDGIRLVEGNFSFPESKKVVFTPKQPWNTDKSYSLNIRANVLDSTGNALGVPVVFGFDVIANERSIVSYSRSGSLFEKFQSVGTVGAVGWEHFTINNEHYLVVGNHYNGSSYGNTNSKIYKWNGTSFVEFQSIGTQGVFDWEYFTINNEHYLVVANYYNGSTRNINSKIYKWNGTSFVEFQSIGTQGAVDWEYFTINNEHYLVVANYNNDSSHNINSKIYKWNGTSFVESQSISTNSAFDWEYFTINNEYYLVVANRTNGSSGNINSKIYKWNGIFFVEFQSIRTNSATNWEYFTINNEHYLVVANGHDGSSVNTNSKIYKLKSSKRYSDNTYAKSCNAYKTEGHYKGNIGNGTYTIDSDGDGGNEPVDVVCDMTSN